MNAQQDLIERQKGELRRTIALLVQAGRQHLAARHHGPPLWLETYAEADKQECNEEGVTTEAAPLVEEFLSHILARPPATADPLCYTPIITSQLIAQIKALPQRPNKAFYIAKNDDDNEKSLMEATGLAGIAWASFYCVLTIDMDRYRNGETAPSVFKLRHFPGFQLSETRPKCLIGSFATACLYSFRSQHVTPGRESTYRPSHVFFETKADADHPQVQMFLTMMGMKSNKHIQVIKPEMKALLEQNVDAVVQAAERSAFPQTTFPHISDMCKGIFCGNCRKTGPQLLKCACGGAYYCNRECQVAVWERHKNFHKQALKKKPGSNDAKKQAKV